MGFLLILVLTAPYSHENIETAISLAQSAIQRNHEVQIHLLMDGVHCANKNIECDKTAFTECNYAEKLQNMIKLGVTVTVCRLCSEYRGLIEESLIEGATFTGLTLFAEKLIFADTFISLGE